MTILWIYNMPLDPQAGGTERITSLVAKGLSGLGHTCLGILVFKQHDSTMHYNGEPITNLYSFLRERNVDIVINQIAYDKWLLQDFLNQGGRRWREGGGKIISCLHFDPKPISDYYYFKSQSNKSLRTWFNLVKAAVLYKYYQKRQRTKIGETFNWIYDNSDRYITLSETHFPYFRRVTHREEYDRLTAISNPLTFDTIADESTLDKKRKVILVCSRMDEFYKRISLVLKAWRQLLRCGEAIGWELKIIGAGPDLDRYKEYARKHRLKQISFVGRQNPEPYYDEASILLLVSNTEGWGLTLTESLQKGVVPVVMNTCSVYGDIIDHCYNGYLTKGSDLGAFVRHIKTLMSDERRLRAMQSNAIESAHRFSLDKTMEKWKEVLVSF